MNKQEPEWAHTFFITKIESHPGIFMSICFLLQNLVDVPTLDGIIQ